MKVDVNNNGKLERGQFEQVLIQIAKEIDVDSPTKDEVDELLETIDVNGDNSIDRAQFSDLIEKVFIMLSTESF